VTAPDSPKEIGHQDLFHRFIQDIISDQDPLILSSVFAAEIDTNALSICFQTVRKGNSQVKYVFTDAEKDALIKRRNGKNVDIQRFKGLGEMDAPTLKSTTMDPATRSILKLRIDDESETRQTFDTLMGKDVRKRFVFIKERSQEVKALDI